MGQTDIPLNSVGTRQAKEAARILVSEPIKHIVSSTLSRAKTTAQIIADVLQIDTTIIDDLKEGGFGLREGKAKSSFELERWLSGDATNNAELALDFELRTMQGFQSALTIPGPVLIVAHGGSWLALQRYMKMPYTSIANCEHFYLRPTEVEGMSWMVTALSPESEYNEYE